MMRNKGWFTVAVGAAMELRGHSNKSNNASAWCIEAPAKSLANIITDLKPMGVQRETSSEPAKRREGFFQPLGRNVQQPP